MTLVGVAVAACLTAALCPPTIRRLEHRAVLDVPVERSSHVVATPRGGGVALAAGVSAGAALVAGADAGSMLTVVGTALAFGALGLTEDLVGVSALARLLLQAALGVLASIALLQEEAFSTLLLVAGLVTAIWIVAFVNAFNFMDGINGISAIQAGVSGGAWALVGAWQDAPALMAAGAVAAGGALGFLPFNFPQAKVFLGDVGSYLLGGWAAALVVVALTSGLTPEMALAPVALYLVDTGSTLVRRIARRAPLTEPHRDHIYQQLAIGGWSHARTSLVVGGLVALCCLLGAVTLVDAIALRIMADAALGAVLVAYSVAPAWQARRRGPAAPLPGDAR